MAFKKIGALWLRDGKKGKYMGGEIEIDGKKISVFVFKNDKGDNPKRPDYQINMADDDRPEAPPQPYIPPQPSYGQGPSDYPPPTPAMSQQGQMNEPDDDGIPF